MIAKRIPNPVVAFFAGLILHYLSDMVPHGDTAVPEKYKDPIHIVAAGLIDVILTLIFLTALVLIKGWQILSLNYICAIIGSVLPDVLQFIYLTRPKNKILVPIQKFHQKIHNTISNKWQFPFFIGLFLQIILFIILIIFI